MLTNLKKTGQPLVLILICLFSGLFLGYIFGRNRSSSEHPEVFQGGRFQFDLRASTGPFLSKPDKEPINLFKDGRFENGFHAEVTGTWWYFDGLICLKNEKSGGKPIVSDFSEQYRGQKASVIYILDNSNNLILAPFNSGLDRTSLIYRRIDKP